MDILSMAVGAVISAIPSWIWGWFMGKRKEKQYQQNARIDALESFNELKDIWHRSGDPDYFYKKIDGLKRLSLKIRFIAIMST